MIVDLSTSIAFEVPATGTFVLKTSGSSSSSSTLGRALAFLGWGA